MKKKVVTLQISYECPKCGHKEVQWYKLMKLKKFEGKT